MTFKEWAAAIKGDPEFYSNDKMMYSDVNCSGYGITTLEGAPKLCYDFKCQNNKLKTLKYGPETCSGNYNCNNNLLENLEGAPKYTGGYFECSGNKLKTLKGGPSYTGLHFKCSSNDLKNLEGAPIFVGGSFLCNDNPLENLKGCPKYVKNNFNCSNTKIDNLNDIPKLIEGDFICKNTNLDPNKSHKVFSNIRGVIVSDVPITVVKDVNEEIEALIDIYEENYTKESWHKIIQMIYEKENRDLAEKMDAAKGEERDKLFFELGEKMGYTVLTKEMHELMMTDLRYFKN